MPSIRTRQSAAQSRSAALAPASHPPPVHTQALAPNLHANGRRQWFLVPQVSPSLLTGRPDPSFVCFRAS